MVRLGLGVDRTGRFDPVAIERTLEAARRYRELIETHGVDARGRTVRRDLGDP